MIGFIPILVEAIKNQQIQINELNVYIENLITDNNLKSETILSSIKMQDQIINNCILYQNDPNPFSIDTRVRFRIPEEVNNSVINIYDLQGKQIKSFNIKGRGDSSIIINGYELDPGIYLYALIADGKEIGTKRMILTE